MKHHQAVVGKNDEWLTPPEIVAALGVFDLDPCAPAVRPWGTAKRHISLPEDGLTAKWVGRVWCNPPFNRYQRPKWMEKMSEHRNGIMLVPAATETVAFENFVFRQADSICFLSGRPHFHFLDGTRAKFNSGTAICLVGYGEENTDILIQARLGMVIEL